MTNQAVVPYEVIDASCLQDLDVMSEALEVSRTSGVPLMLPETVVVDLSAGRKPEVSWRRAAKFLSKYPDRVAVALSAGLIFRHELDHGVPVADVMDKEATPRFQSLLWAYKYDFKRRIDATLAAFRADMHNDHRLQAAIHKQRLLDGLSRLASALPEVVTKALRQGEFDAVIPTVLASPRVRDELVVLLKDILLRTGSKVGELQLVENETSITHYAYLRMTYEMLWLGRGGATTRPENKFSHDARDLEYALLAMRTGHLRSADVDLGNVTRWNLEAMDLRIRGRAAR